ncbi:MAG: hypothetical protein H6Q70_481 [Firmicutes bacterium]|nr:hypothetical protein [Bacillota bacterium]
MTKFESVLLGAEKSLQTARRLEVLRNLQKAINAVPVYGAVKLELHEFHNNKLDYVIIRFGAGKVQKVYIDDTDSEMSIVHDIAAFIP